MLTKRYDLNAGIGRDVVIAVPYTFIGIVLATGLISLKGQGFDLFDLVENSMIPIANGAHGNLFLTSTNTETITLIFGDKDDKIPKLPSPIGTVNANFPQPDLIAFKDSGNITQPAKGDAISNIFTRSKDGFGNGSIAPASGMYQQSLDGEQWVTFQLDPATYVSGESGIPLLYVNPGNTVPAEVIDMSTGAQVSAISDPLTIYKIKTQGANYLLIDAGTLMGNGAGGNFNFISTWGYEPWVDVCPPSLNILAPFNLISAVPVVTGVIERPKNAKGFIVMVEAILIDPANALALAMVAVNPITGSMANNTFAVYTSGPFTPLVPGIFLGWTVYPSIANFNPIVGARADNTILPDRFVFSFTDANATLLTPDNGIRLDIQWLY